MRLNYVCNIRHTAIACFEGVAIEDLVQGVIASKVLVHKLEKGFRYVRHDILAEWRVEPNYLPCSFLFLVGVAFSALLFVAQVCRVSACSEGIVVGT